VRNAYQEEMRNMLTVIRECNITVKERIIIYLYFTYVFRFLSEFIEN